MNIRDLRVLIAEDDEEDYLIAQDLLAEIPRFRFHLDWAPSYERALEAIEGNRHDLCLLDYRLGSGDGLQLLNEALARGCTTPIVFLTGLDDWEIDLKAMKAGAADYLVKGQFDSKQLERTIHHAIERSQAQVERLGKTLEQLECAVTMAQTDTLTGLGNRRKVEQTMQEAIAASHSFSVLVFDMNGFKLVNDVHGHNQGDQLLKLVAQRMRSAVRDHDIVCRWGGDEFVVIMPHTPLCIAEERAANIVGRTFGEFTLNANGKIVRVVADASFGAAEYTPGETAAEFFERADRLLLEKKRHRLSIRPAMAV